MDLLRKVIYMSFVNPAGPPTVPCIGPSSTGVSGSPRRRVLVLITLVGLLAGACATPEQANTESASEDGQSFPVTIEHVHGSTTVPSEPERVVSVGFNDQDVLLALGIKPVAVREWFGEQPFATWPWAQDELGDAEPEVLGAQELNFEVIAGLRPDLIVGVYSEITEPEYAKLSEIAPTIARPVEHAEYGVPWQEQTRIIGDAVGRQDRAEELVEEVEAKFAAVREDHPEFQGKSAVVAYSFEAGSYGAYSSVDLRSRVLEELGFEIPERIDELAGEEFFAEISAEQLELLDADVLVWILLVESSVVTDDALYQQLRAFQEGRDVFPSEEVRGAMSFSTVLSLPFLLEELVPQLAAAVDGDPATE
ncbi:MAG: iron-siderophore ABC transporter substrate-binding protein [Actinomycetota bacterium]